MKFLIFKNKYPLNIVVTSGKSYLKVTQKSCDEIRDENNEYTKRLGFKITEKEKALPTMSCTPKMHKNSTGASFIIASKMCFTKQISKFISNPFILIYFQIENFYKNAKFISNYLGSYRTLTTSFNR